VGKKGSTSILVRLYAKISRELEGGKGACESSHSQLSGTLLHRGLIDGCDMIHNHHYWKELTQQGSGGAGYGTRSSIGR